MTTSHAALTHSATSRIDLYDEVGLSVLRRPAHTIARLRGELDIATAPALRERLTALLRLRMPVPLLVLDLTGVWFCDAAGLAVLIGTQRRATSLGTVLRLAAPRSQVARVLHVTGLGRSLSIHPTVAAALAELAPGTPPRPPGRPYPRSTPARNRGRRGTTGLAGDSPDGMGTPLSLVQPLRPEDPEIAQPAVDCGRP